MTVKRSLVLALILATAALGCGGGEPARATSDEAPLPSAEARAIFLRALEDDDRGVRFAAAQALEKAGAGALAALPALDRALGDDEWCVRRQAARAIAALGEEGRPRLEAAAADSDPNRRDAGAYGLVFLARRSGPAGGEAPPARADPELDDVAWLMERLRQRADGSDDPIGAIVDGEAGAGGEAGPAEVDRIVWTVPSRDRTFSLFVGLAGHDDPQRRALALRGLRMLARRAPFTESERAAIPAGRWRALFEDDDPTVRAAAVWAWSAVSPHDATGLVARLDDDDRIVREVAIDALARTTEDVVPALLPRWRDGDARTALDAARILRERGLVCGRSTRALVERVADPNPEVRRAAVAALAVVGPKSDIALAAVMSRLHDPWRDVRIQTAISLGAMDAAAVPLLRRALADPNGRVRRQAAKSLARFAGTRAFDAGVAEALVARLTDDDLGVSQAAVETLRGAGPVVAEPLAELLATGHYAALPAAERIFASLGEHGAAATDALAKLVAHPDVNVREVAVRCLGEIGPPAATARPALVRALRDPRISVRSRAAVALGRLGPEVSRPLATAATDADARVRAGAIFALGWITALPSAHLGGDLGPQTPFEIRLPTAEPGPAAATGFVPTKLQLERARVLAAALPSEEESEEENAKLGGELDRNEVVDALRAGIRTADLAVAVGCARRLEMANLDAWESERCVELLLPECFRDPESGLFHRVYEYLGSSEVAATLGYLALSDFDTEIDVAMGDGLIERREARIGILGVLHRIVRSDLLPELHRLERSADAWVIEGSGDVWMPRAYTDRREERAGDAGLSEGLRRRLATVDELDAGDRRWLGDSAAAPHDVSLLLAFARRRLSDEREPGEIVFDLGAVVRALARLDDARSELLLAALEDDALQDCVVLARARRGDPDVLRDLFPRDPSALLEARPELALEVIVAELTRPADPDLEWSGRIADFDRFGGGRWSASTLLGWEPAVLAADPPAERLASCIQELPGLRTKRLARRLLARWRESAPVVAAEMAGDSGPSADVIEFLALAEPAATIELLTQWTKGSSELAELASVALAAITAKEPSEATPIESLREAARRRAAELSCPSALGLLVLAGDTRARAELWSGIRAGRYRWICYENDDDALTLGWSPATFPQLVEELHTNCCRGGHVARLFEKHWAGGWGPKIGWSAGEGLSGGPVVGLRTALELGGGSWVRVAFEWPDERTIGPGWRPVVE